MKDLIKLTGDEVIHTDGNSYLMNQKTFKITELMKRIAERLGLNGEQRKAWMETGLDCELLAPNQTWRKGKVKIALEFYPDEPEFPLDDIRQGINIEE